MSKTSYYEILGLREDVSLKEVDTAYANARIKYNPSKNPDNEFLKTMSLQIEEAYLAICEEIKLQDQTNSIPSEVEYTETGTSSEVKNLDKNSRIAYISLFVLLAVFSIGIGYYYFTVFFKSTNDLETPIVEEANVSRPIDKEEDLVGESTVQTNEFESTVTDVKVIDKDNYTHSKPEETLVNKEEHIKESSNSNKKSQLDNLVVSDGKEETLAKEVVNTVHEEKVIVAKRNFRIGSSQKDVEDSQGKPKSVHAHLDIDIWFYGDNSRVRFKNGYVIDYVDPYNELNIKK
ncbi:J domain-containing protein [Myroides marinus]|uniref:J domain-containing protein n=1 Tax=Myroides marinus TaxID=703342 RepID=UPI002574A947|nr:DnaJ domain-containing protein [Myroides marinus]MDM1376341.1 DnaJ domain-containing protein [Myroides marinus]MDM1382065.1 DnaJ domain-containing protein [Myroides marinus]